MTGPRERTDYRLAKIAYFTAPFVWMIECVHEPCGYNTGKQTRHRDALDSYYAHWKAMHQSDATTPGSISPL
jgi:hypothetical protein